MSKLKEKKIWLCWNYETQKGKKTKVPYAASGRRAGASPDYKSLWTTYAEAKAAQEKRGFDGVGFVLLEGYVLIDIDHKGTDDPLVKKMLTRCESYAEKSVSGSGIHIICRTDISKLPTRMDHGKRRLDRQFYIKNPHNGMEIYIGGLTNRFATFSGNSITDYPITDCTNALLVTLDKDMRRKPKVNYSPKRDGESQEEEADFDLICSMRRQKNGEKFIRLYDKGDTDNFGSRSEADAALCAMLAFRCGNDPDHIDRLFRESALYREKWERDDYREATIEAGINSCNGHFHESVMEHPDFIKFTNKGVPYVSVPLLAEHVRQNIRYILVRDSGMQSIRLYVYKHGVYLLYSKDMMLGEIKQFVANYDPELVKIPEISAAYDHIMTDLNYVSEDDLNSDESLINFQNGLLRVTADSLTLLPHTPDIYSTIQIPCRWNGVPSPTPVFDRYFDTLTDGDTDVQLLLYEWIGAVLSNIPGYRAKKALFMVGNGDTGKSQIKSLVERIIGGENHTGIDLKEIEARFGTGAVYGKRLAGSSDMSFMSINELKTFKCMTGGDNVFAEFKGQQPFKYKYRGYLWFCMNKLPKFGGDDDGRWVYERIMIVKCNNVIPKEKQDNRIQDKMYEERDGIVYKAVKALQTFIADGDRFREPDSVVASRDEYMEDNSTVVGFITEYIQETPEEMKSKDVNTTGEIYDCYKAWCCREGEKYAKSAKDFRDGLCSYFGGTYKTMTFHTERGTCYKGYTLTEKGRKECTSF